MPNSLASGPDEVSIQVSSNRFQGWQTVSISKSCESMPNTWSVTACTEFLQGAALAGLLGIWVSLFLWRGRE